MRLLLDTCVSPRVRDELRAAGHDVVWIGDWSNDPGDDAVLEFALREARVLITLDKDFGELAVVFGRQHCGIVRLVDLSVTQVGKLCAAALERYGSDLARGGLLTVEPHRVRLRPAEEDEQQ